MGQSGPMQVVPSNKLFGPEGMLVQKRQEFYEPLFAKINDAIYQIAEEEGYDFIFDIAEEKGWVVFARNEYDITDQVVGRLVEEN